MSDLEHTVRCAACATTEGPFERHHIALRANHESATVTLCQRCHDEQTDRQRQAGLFTRKSIEAGDELRTLRALIEGLAGMLAANARILGDGQLAERGEQDRRATLRLLALASDGRPGQLGPLPISNDRRRRILRHPSSRRRDAPSPAVMLRALAPLFTALLEVVDALLPDEVGPGLVRDFTRALACIGRQLSADSDRCAGLAALDDHPRAGELTAVIEQQRTLWHELVEQIDALAAVGDRSAKPDTGLIETGRAFAEGARRCLIILQAITAGEDPAGVLDRLLAESEPTRCLPAPAFQERVL